MTHDDYHITSALLEAFPVVDAPNWGDVDRRAAAYRAASRRRVVAAMFASLVVLLAVAPATGIVGHVRDLFHGTPAPPAVQTAMQQVSDALRNRLYIRDAGSVLHDRYSPVIATETHGVVSADTPDGPIYVWAAPTESGTSVGSSRRAKTTTPGGRTARVRAIQQTRPRC